MFQEPTRHTPARPSLSGAWRRLIRSLVVVVTACVTIAGCVGVGGPVATLVALIAIIPALFGASDVGRHGGRIVTVLSDR